MAELLLLTAHGGPSPPLPRPRQRLARAQRPRKGERESDELDPECATHPREEREKVRALILMSRSKLYQFSVAFDSIVFSIKPPNTHDVQPETSFTRTSCEPPTNLHGKSS